MCACSAQNSAIFGAEELRLSSLPTCLIKILAMTVFETSKKAIQFEEFCFPTKLKFIVQGLPYVAVLTCQIITLNSAAAQKYNWWVQAQYTT